MTKAGLQKRPAYLAYHWFWRALDWIFPPACAGCGRIGERWCGDCQREVVRLPGLVCSRCGQPQRGNLICRRCQETPPTYLALRSYAEFGGDFRECIHKLKYKGNSGMGEALSVPLIELTHKLGWDFDLVIPVPLSPGRLAERGYNQAALLARPLALAFGLPCLPHGLARIRETASQVHLSTDERRKNVSGAFAANGAAVRGHTVLMVDDVTTTGSTVEACAQALLVGGAIKIYGVTLARAVLRLNKNTVQEFQNQLHIQPS